MQEILFAVIGFLFGSCFGIMTMCLFQINKNRDYIMRKDDTENEK